MALTQPQDLTKRILNPSGKNETVGQHSSTSHGTPQDTQTTPSPRQTGTVSVLGSQTIPTPSSIFRSTMVGFQEHRRSALPPPSPSGFASHAHPEVPRMASMVAPMTAPPPSTTPHLRMTPSSKTKQKEHARQLAQLNRLTQGVTKRTSTSSSSSHVPSWRRNPMGRIIDTLKRTAGLETMQLPEVNQAMNTDDLDVLHEFDRDVSEAMVVMGGRFLQIPPEELLHSVGLRKLITRNMRWFHRTPDCLKMVAILLAKKFNGEVRRFSSSLASSSASLLSPPSSTDLFINENPSVNAAAVSSSEWENLPPLIGPVENPQDESTGDQHNRIIESQLPSSQSSEMEPPMETPGSTQKSKVKKGSKVQSEAVSKVQKGAKKRLTTEEAPVAKKTKTKAAPTIVTTIQEKTKKKKSSPKKKTRDVHSNATLPNQPPTNTKADPILDGPSGDVDVIDVDAEPEVMVGGAASMTVDADSQGCP